MSAPRAYVRPDPIDRDRDVTCRATGVPAGAREDWENVACSLPKGHGGDHWDSMDAVWFTLADEAEAAA